MAVARLLTLYALLTRTRDVLAATHTYDWNITWTTANPDGVFERPVIGINNEWPLPMLNVTKGDRIVAKVTNGLGNETTSIHFHGMYQNGTSEMDGPVGVTQCDIPPGSTFIYNFTVDQEGSYWYHSHSRGQYPDGLRQAFFITDPEGPYLGKYDAEIPITLSDWYHDQMPTLLKQFINVENPTGAEPVPNNALMNDTQDLKVPVEAGKTYMLRIVNIGAFAGQYFWIEGHTMRIVEVDGIWTNESETDMIYITAAQRYSVLVTMKNSTTNNYVIQASMDTSLFDTVPSDLNWNVTGWLQYDSSASFPAPAVKDELNPFDDFYLVPTDGEALLPPSDLTITLDLTMDNLGDGANYAFFNDISYVTPKVPTLFSVMTTGADAVNPMVYGTDSNAYVLNKGDVVDIVLNNDDTGKHPFHLHGHNFQVIERSNENDGHWNSANESSYPAVPMRRDTLMARPLGNFVIRFVADNPGVWFFHCHIDWHLVTGLAALMIEAPLEMQKTLSIPDNHYEVCKAANTPYAGNAAGNTVDYLDLTGENRMVKRLPSGFTTKGYVALVFSCVSGALGMAAVAWYGTLPISPATTRNP